MARISLLTISLAALLTCSPAQAAFKGCYERVYDKAYIKKHPKQAVMKMRLQIGVSSSADDPLELKDRIDAGFRSSKIYKGKRISCTDNGEALRCAMDDNSGSFTVIDRGENSIRITNEKRMQFDDGGGDTTIAAKGDNREFRLFRISEGACP